jgi:predicted  nucleic acid-binding Zn-ribbon protein
VDKSKKNGLDSLGNVDQIRELLFGTQLKEITGSIEALSEKFTALQTSVEASTKSLKEELNQRLEDDISSMQKRLKQATSQLKEEITDVSEQTVKLERRVQTAAETRAQDIEETIDANKMAAQKAVNALKDELHTVQENLKQQLNSLLLSVDEKQLSKEMMSEMFMNMAMQVKDVALNVVTQEKKK